MSICVATTTRYENLSAFRLSLALKTLEALREHGIPAVVVDSSPDDVKNRLRSVDNTNNIIPETPGKTMGEGRRQALRNTCTHSNPRIITVWTELEKYPLVPHIKRICAPIIAGNADIVIPRRADNLISYPETQRYAELCGNSIFKQVTGRAFDVWFGPRAMNAAGLAHFLQYNGSYGDKWEAIFMPILTALRAGLRVTEVVVDYVHPPEQTQFENADPSLSIIKRLKQLYTLGNALVQQTQALELCL